MRKSQFLVRLANAREDWEHALNYVGSIRLGIGGVSGHWSARDVLAHILSREQYIADRLHEIAQGESLPPCQTQEELETYYTDFGYPDYESPLLTEADANEWAVRKLKHTPFMELIELELRVYDSIYESVKTLSEEQLNENNLFKRIARYTAEHYRHHATDIRKRFNLPVIR
ncbi:MAG: hypothetical protein C4583_02810 [Anaerolineaceae bacterium]|nr:MAG: hypothetical protein C4583_02810 [Anaerolineaceae bacterium]